MNKDFPDERSLSTVLPLKGQILTRFSKPLTFISCVFAQRTVFIPRLDL